MKLIKKKKPPDKESSKTTTTTTKYSHIKLFCDNLIVDKRQLSNKKKREKGVEVKVVNAYIMPASQIIVYKKNHAV